MTRVLLTLLALMIATPSYAAGMNDDPILTMVRIDQLEITDIGKDNNSAWDAQIGWRHDIKPTPDRDWLALGVLVPT